MRLKRERGLCILKIQDDQLSTGRMVRVLRPSRLPLALLRPLPYVSGACLEHGVRRLCFRHH